MNTRFILTITAEHMPGLISQVTGILNRRKLDIESLSASRSHIPRVSVVTVELFSDPGTLRRLQGRLNNIIEVYSVVFSEVDETVFQRSAFFRMKKSFLSAGAYPQLSLHQAQIVNMGPYSILIAQSGTDLAISRLREKLSGPHLIAFAISGPVAESALDTADLEPVMDLAA